MGETDDQPHTNHSTMIAVTYCTRVLISCGIGCDSISKLYRVYATF